MANSLWLDLRRSSVSKIEQARGALPLIIKPVVISLVSLSALFMIGLLTRRVRHYGWGPALKMWRPVSAADASRVDFYERLITLLEKQGIRRESYQTPLEFASAVGISEAHAITNAYNRVRFGEERLSNAERDQIEDLLSQVERNRTNS